MTNERKVAVVTGAAQGIGRATARELARRGYALALADVAAGPLADLAAELRAAGAEVLETVLDVGDATAQRALAARCQERFGRVDALINNAGIVRVRSFEATTEEDWRRQFEVNLLGMILGIQAFLPLLRASRGHIVNLGSGTSLLPFPGYCAYGSLKVSVLWLSHYIRAELRGSGVSVTCLCPLLVRTGIGQEIQRHATRQPEWMFDTPEHIAGRIAGALQSRRFLVYGNVSMRLLHLFYRVSPWLLGWVFARQTRGQLDAEQTAIQSNLPSSSAR